MGLKKMNPIKIIHIGRFCADSYRAIFQLIFQISIVFCCKRFSHIISAAEKTR